MILCAVQGFQVVQVEVDADYSKWLGPNWRQELEQFKKTKRCSTYVSNHVAGLLDICVLCKALYGNTGYVAKA